MPDPARSPWVFTDIDSAKLCAASTDAQAYSPMQKASAIAFLRSEGRLNDRSIAALSGMSTSAIRHHLRVANKLDNALLSLLHKEQISFGQAKLLAGLPRSQQHDVAQKCVANRWTVSKLKAFIDNEEVSESPTDTQSYYQQISEKMSEQIGFPVKVNIKGGGPQGKIEIQYFSLDDFDSLCELLQIELDEF